MTPKEWEFLYGLLEHSAKHFYEQGKAGKSLTDKDFKIGPHHRLRLQTELKKATKTR